MPATTLTQPTTTAWLPLPESDWNAEAARHLLRRAGWTARPEDTERAVKEGLAATLDRLFPAQPALFPLPQRVDQWVESIPEYRQKIIGAEPDQRRMIERQERESAQLAVRDMSIEWLQYAALPENSAMAKWVLFLSDIYVVAADKVKNPDLIYRHFDIISRLGMGSAPVLSKAISRSPAMVMYLDLNENRRLAPNENFARELFELFLLGEGNYTETDIKQAARAFTGYRVRPGGEFAYYPILHDNGDKTVFGHTGPFTGDEVIDLAYGLPAAGAFVPHEMVKFYLSDTMLPREYLYALGDAWRTEGNYDLRWLAQRFFGSRMFFAPEFRGDFIKSPVQFYLGLLQDLDLNVTPVPRYVLNTMRQMGQILFYPPNVRGWVGGRAWINSASLAARRNTIEVLFTPLDEERLNADEQRDIDAARAGGTGRFVVSEATLRPLLSLPPESAVARLQSDFLTAPAEPAFQRSLSQYLAAATDGDGRLRHLRRAAITLFESPEYQLC